MTRISRKTWKDASLVFDRNDRNYWAIRYQEATLCPLLDAGFYMIAFYPVLATFLFFVMAAVVISYWRCGSFSLVPMTLGKEPQRHGHSARAAVVVSLVSWDKAERTTAPLGKNHSARAAVVLSYWRCGSFCLVPMTLGKQPQRRLPDYFP